MNQGIKWRYFVLIAGVMIPAFFFFATKQPFEYNFTRPALVTGLNPYAPFIFCLIIAIFFALPFKIFRKLRISATAFSVFYFTWSALVVWLLLQGILPSNLPHGNEMITDPRRYTDIAGVFSDERSFLQKNANLFAHIAILCIFLLFVYTRRPTRVNIHPSPISPVNER